MEELRKLEQVQSVLMFMQSREFLDSSNLDSSRFLANLILLLVQPCGELDIGEKCSLISEYVPKISAAFLEEASQWLGLKTVLHSEGKQDNRGYQQSHVHGTKIGKRHCDSLQVKEKDVAMVGLDAMERANSTLEDFCRSYFMFHGVDINRPQSLFKYLPLLAFVESYIYQLDGLNEEILHVATEEVPGLERGSEEIVDQGRRTKFNDAFETDPFKPLVGVLKCRDLLTERIIEEFRGGEEYWALERKLCCAVIGNKEISIEDSLRAIHLKSFDYRVLNLLLYQLRGEEVNDLHMEFLSVSEFLVEISDDLFDYEVSLFPDGFLSTSYMMPFYSSILNSPYIVDSMQDDVLENNFNILRMFVKIYGPSVAPAMLAKYITEAEERYGNLLKTLDPQLSLNYQRRCEEATKEGGKVSGHSLGTWNIPPLILDEDLYRSNCLSPK
ncbi:hypothetical protein SLE2022_297440 [Rubroshorea leprosula]